MAHFGLKYYAQLRSKYKGVLWRVEIAERDYSGASEEMEFSVSDWMDLYADGTSESRSPLRQVYVDMERFYFVYEEPTFRDALELCLRPFAGSQNIKISLGEQFTARGRDLVYILGKENFKLDVLGG